MNIRFGLLFGILLTTLTLPAGATAEIDPARRAELLHLLRQDCGSCHGMTLKGGLGPSLLPEALNEKSREMLRATILIGRAGTPMPPWSAIITEEEADFLVSVLKEGASDEQ